MVDLIKDVLDSLTLYFVFFYPGIITIFVYRFVRGRSIVENQMTFIKGCPMDFISAMRFVDEQLEWFESLSEEEKEALLHKDEPQYDTQSDEPVFCMSFALRDLYPDEELPFQ